MSTARLDVTINGNGNIDKFLKQTEDELKNLKDASNAVGGTALVMGGAIVASAIMSVKKYAEMGSAVYDMSKRIGFATDSTSEWSYILEQCGSNISDLQVATKTMSSAIIDAGRGVDSSARAFKALHLNVKDLLAMSPEKQFETIAYALADVENQTLKSSLAQDIFGRSATNILPVLDEGTQGIERMRSKAQELGIVFSEDAAKKADELGDSIQDTEESVNGLQYSLAQALLPSIQPVINKVTEAVTAFNSWTQANPETAQSVTTVVLALGGLLTVAGSFVLAAPRVIAGLAAITKVIHGLTAATSLSSLAMTGAVGAGIALTAALVALTYATYKLSQAEQARFNALESDKNNNYLWSVSQATTLTKGLTQAQVEAGNSTIQEMLAQSRLKNQLDEVTAATGLATLATDEQTQAQERARLAALAADEQFRQLQLTLEFTGSQADKLGLTMEDVYNYMWQMSYSVEEVRRIFDEYGLEVANTQEALNVLGIDATAVANTMSMLAQNTLGSIPALKSLTDQLNVTKTAADDLNASLGAGDKYKAAREAYANADPQSEEGRRLLLETQNAFIQDRAAYAAAHPGTALVDAGLAVLGESGSSSVTQNADGSYSYKKMARGGTIDQPSLLYGLRSKSFYAMAGEAGNEDVVPRNGSGNIHVHLDVDGRELTSIVLSRAGKLLKDQGVTR